MRQLQGDFKDVFTGIGCFDGMFSMQVKTRQQTIPGMPLRHVAYTLLKPLKEELE